MTILKRMLLRMSQHNVESFAHFPEKIHKTVIKDLNELAMYEGNAIPGPTNVSEMGFSNNPFSNFHGSEPTHSPAMSRDCTPGCLFCCISKQREKKEESSEHNVKKN